jgi:hypothetical protein
MAINSVDDIVAALYANPSLTRLLWKSLPVQTGGIPFDLWVAPGVPGVGAFSTSGLAGDALVGPLPGGLPIANAGSGKVNYLARAASLGQSSGGAMLCDRLWQNNGVSLTINSVQAINSVAWPARDVNGATNGEGVYIAIENAVPSAGGNTMAMTMTYTNSAGVSGRTATLISTPYSATGTVGRMQFFGLQAGDTGVRSVQSVQLTSTVFTSGTMNMIAYRPLAFLDVPGAYFSMLEAASLSLPVIYDNSVLFMWLMPSNSSAQILSAVFNAIQK